MPDRPSPSLMGRGREIVTQALSALQQVIRPQPGGPLPPEPLPAAPTDQGTSKPEETRTPDVRPYREVPVTTFYEWDRAQQISSMLNQLEYGNLMQAALFCDAILRDDRVSAALTTRVNGLLGLPLEFRQAGPARKARKIAELLRGDEDRLGLFDKIFPPSDLAELLRWGLLLGVGLGELVWDTDSHVEGAEWLPRLKIWHPWQLYWQWDQGLPDSGSFKLITANESVIDVTPGDGKWILFTPFGYRRAWLRGIMRSLAMLFVSRQWTYRDWNRYNEVHGIPARLAEVPADASTSAKLRYFNQVANLGSEPTLLVEKRPEGGQTPSANYGFSLVEAKADTYQGFAQFLKQNETCIEIAFLGHALNNEVKSGIKAAEWSASQIRDDLRAFDAREVAHVLHDQAIAYFAEWNYGDAALAPLPQYQVDPPEDEAAEAKSLSDLAGAIGALVEAGMTRVDYNAILEAHGVPLLPEGQAPQVAPPALPPGPMGSGGPPVKLHDRPAVDHKEFSGLSIAIENPAGTLRTWKEDKPNAPGKRIDAEADGGKTGETLMRFDYGRIEGYIGADGDEIDCYLGHDKDAANVYVVHQMKASDPSKYDEDKVFLGFPDADAAKKAYLAHRDDGERCFGGMSTIPLDEFKRKLKKRMDTDAPIRNRDAHAHAIVTLKAAGKRRAKFYDERLADKAQAHATDVMHRDYAAVLSAVRDARDYDDLRGRLKERFRDMDPKALARLVARSMTLAELHGRYEALAQATTQRRK